MTTPLFRLSDMELDFVSLVAAGDDPLAQVVIAKAAPVEKQKNPGQNTPHEYVNEDGDKHGEKHCDVCGQGPNSPMHAAKRKRMKKSAEAGGGSPTIHSNNLNTEDHMGTIKKDGLDPDVLDYIEGLETEVETLSSQVAKSSDDVEALESEVTRLKAEADASITKSDEDREKDLLAKADPAVRSLIEKQNAQIAKAEEIAKAEREARLTREYIAKAEQMPNVAVDGKDGETGPAALAGLLRRAAEALTPEDSASLEKALGALNSQVAKSDLFREFGSGGGETTISKSAEAKADELRKADPSLTREQALVKVYEDDPALAMKIEHGEDA